MGSHPTTSPLSARPIFRAAHQRVYQNLDSQPHSLGGICLCCILVLGCGVKPDGTPTAMLEDRLLQAIHLYEQGASGKLLVSGDHGRADYDEVNVM